MNLRTLPFYAYQRLGLMRGLLFCIALLLMQYVSAGEDMDPCRFKFVVRITECR